MSGDLAIIHGTPLEEEPGLGALTLPGFLAEVCGRYGPREALVMFEGDAASARWTYDELWTRSMEVAQALIASGLGKGEYVGVLMTNRLEWVASCFGIAMAGGVTVGLSTFSTPEELEKLLELSGVSVLLFERHVAGKDFATILAGLDHAKFPYLRRIAVVDRDPPLAPFESWEQFLAHGEQIAEAQVEARSAQVHPSDPALLFFSSGSTGKPKGILNAHRAVCIQSWRWVRIYCITPEDHLRTWGPNGLFWSGNFSLSLGGTLAAGGALILQRTFDPAEAVRLLEAERVSLPYCWPHQWAQLEDAPGWDEADLSSFKFFEPAQNLRREQKTISTPWIEPHASYGSTETFTISASYPCDSPEDLWKGNNGGALPGNTIRIVDPETGRVLKRGETGEIAVKGPTLMLGYIGVPNDESLDAEGFYHAGDGGFIDERDRLVFQGRINDIIKTGGANVSPVEIDWTLCNCPGVKVCKTTGVPHETLGEMVVSCVVRVEGSELSEAEVIAFLKARLAAYKVPRKVLFIEQGDLDFTDTAKIKPAEARAFARRKLGEMAE
ncbi:MAG: class I adenylate-forming enzyme family protein [Novosphingobium sp.]